MDRFRFSTQGINYEKFRPHYPQRWIQQSLESLKHKDKYLDIATGTGQLLFAFAPHFQSNKGIDKSKNMIENAKKVKEAFPQNTPQSRVLLEINDVMNIEENVENEKYDLITVGMALHYFPIEDSLKKIQNMLSNDGCFTAFGYVPTLVLSSNQNEHYLFSQIFYNKVKQQVNEQCQYNRDDLHNFYEDPVKYPFSKIFSRVERQTEDTTITMSKTEYISYLGTMSSYNLYLLKNKDDPLQELSNVCADQITIIFTYFRISCYL